MLDETQDPMFAYLIGAKLRKADLTKVSIVRATVEFLNTHPVEEITLQKVGKIAGLRPSHVAYHFQKKEDLIEAAIRFIAAAWQAHGTLATKGIKDPQLLLEATVSADFSWIEKEKSHRPVIGLLLYYASLGGRYRDLYWEARKAGLAELEGILFECLPNLNSKKIRQLARDIQHLITGKALECLCAPESYSVKELTKDTLRLMRILIRGAA